MSKKAKSKLTSEGGSDWASTLHEIDDMGRSLGKQLGFKQEHWYSDFE